MNSFRSITVLLISVIQLSSHAASDLPQEGLRQRPVKFIFAHGLEASSEQVNYYNGINSDLRIVNDDCITFDFPDVVRTPGTAEPGYNRSKSNLAQDGDIQALRAACLPYINEYDLVLVGLSRGASTILNYAAQYPEGIKALVVESPFSSVTSVIKNVMKREGFGFIPTSLINIGLGIVINNYKPTGISPMESITKIPKDVPILFIHSIEDNLIAYSDSLELIQARQEIECDNVFLCTLTRSSHSNYQEHLDDTNLYKEAVYEFYQTHGILDYLI